LRDLLGQPIGVNFDNTDVLTYRAMLRGAKPPIPEQEMKEVPIQSGDIQPLIDGHVKAIPAYTINEPIRIEMEYKKEVNIISPTAYDVDLYGDTLFITDEMEAEHTDLVDSFVEASICGWRYALEHPEDAVKATLEHDKSLNANLERRKMAALLDLIGGSPEARKNFGQMSYARWKGVQGLFEGQFGADHVDLTSLFTQAHLPREDVDCSTAALK